MRRLVSYLRSGDAKEPLLSPVSISMMISSHSSATGSRRSTHLVDGDGRCVASPGKSPEQCAAIGARYDLRAARRCSIIGDSSSTACRTELAPESKQAAAARAAVSRDRSGADASARWFGLVSTIALEPNSEAAAGRVGAKLVEWKRRRARSEGLSFRRIVGAGAAQPRARENHSK